MSVALELLIPPPKANRASRNFNSSLLYSLLLLHPRITNLHIQGSVFKDYHQISHSRIYTMEAHNNIDLSSSSVPRAISTR